MMSASPASYRARPRRRWIWVSVAVVTALVLVVPVAFRIGLKGEIRHQVVPLTLFQRPVSELQVNAPGQSVSILPGQAGQVTVVSTMSWLVGRPTIRHVWHGRALQISASCPKFNVFEDCQASLAIRVPASVTVQVAVGSGSATVAGLTGPLRLTASSGSISLTHVSGPIWAKATSGDINATSGLTSRRVSASITTGSFALGFAAPPLAIALQVGSGSATVTLPPGTRYQVSGQRGSGTLQVGPGLRDNGSARVIAAVVGSGALALLYARPVSPPAGPPSGGA
jgi:hypothetical protein